MAGTIGIAASRPVLAWAADTFVHVHVTIASEVARP